MPLRLKLLENVAHRICDEPFSLVRHCALVSLAPAGECLPLMIF
jgi:hypothetical protein